MAISATEVTDEFEGEYVQRFYSEFGYPRFYSETHYHYVNENNSSASVSWTLIKCGTDIGENPDGNAYATYAVVGEVLIYVQYLYEPFKTGYAIYDVEKDKFIDLFDVALDEYEGLREYLFTAEIGKPIGDVDGDKVLTIIDATNIQMCLAGVSEFSSWDIYGRKYSWIGGKSIQYLSDVDQDGERTIMDATAIQLKLAGIE